MNNKKLCAGVLLPYMQASIYLVGAPWPDREINANADLKMFFFLFLPIYRRRKTKINRILLITHLFESKKKPHQILGRASQQQQKYSEELPFCMLISLTLSKPY